MSCTTRKFNYITAFLIFMSCGKQDMPQDNFLDSEVQQTEKRAVVEDGIILDFEKEMDELNIYSFYNIVETDDKFLIPQNKNFLISVLDKSNLSLDGMIEMKKGRGPGEIEHFMDFDATSEFVAIVERSQSKVALLDYEGNLIQEFRTKESIPHRLSIASDGSINILYESGLSESKNRILENLGQDGELNYIIPEGEISGFNPFVTEGQIEDYNDALYYVGYYELFIKKYMDGELIYSRSTIDNYDTSANYMMTVSGEERTFGLTPATLISSNDFDLKGERLFIIPNSNGDPNFSFIDIYNTETGGYVESFRTLDRAINLNVYEDEDAILTIEYSNERFLFRKYKMLGY